MRDACLAGLQETAQCRWHRRWGREIAKKVPKCTETSERTKLGAEKREKAKAQNSRSKSVGSFVNLMGQRYGAVKHRSLQPHVAPPARTSCLTHDWAAACGCFLGERHAPERIRPSPVCWPQNPLYFTGTKCHGCSHTTKECRPRSSVIVFSSVSNGRGRACQLLAVAQILPTGQAKISAVGVCCSQPPYPLDPKGRALGMSRYAIHST